MMIQNNHKSSWILAVLTVILWALSAIIAFILLAPVLDSIITIYAAFWADPDPIGNAYYLGVSIRQVGVMVLAVLFVIGIIGGAEHHLKHFNTPSSWHLMILTYTILLTSYLFTILF